MNKEELLEDFLTFLDTAIDTYCEEMELDEEVKAFLIEAIQGGSDEEAENEETPELDAEQLGTAFRQFLLQHQFANVQEGFKNFAETHKLDEVNKKKLANYIETATKGATVVEETKTTKTKTLNENANPKMARYLRALGC